MELKSIDPVEDGIDCYQCKFFKPTRKDGSEGECRRFPPVFVQSMSTVDAGSKDALRDMQDEIGSTWVWHFPIVSSEMQDWCGEFQRHPLAGEYGDTWRSPSR
jgi:hypothetical protein